MGKAVLTKLQRSFRFAVTMCLLPLLMGCFSSAEKTDAKPLDPMVEGKKIYIRYCLSCHQRDGTGVVRGGVLAADLTQPGGPLRQSDEVLYDSVWNGKSGPTGRMPAFKPILDPNEIRAVLAYIRKTYGAEPAAGTEPAPGSETPADPGAAEK